MSNFSLRFATDNAAFGETMTDAALETARILRELADLIEEQGLPETGQLESVRDSNGNTVGDYHHREAT